MAGTAENDGAFTSRGVCVHPYADARSLTRAVGWSLAWLLSLAALVRLLVPLLDSAALLLAVPVGLLGAVLILICLTCMLCLPLAWLCAVVGCSRAAVVRVTNALWIEEQGGKTSFPLASLTSARLSNGSSEIALKTDEGDVIRVRVEGAEDAERLLIAIATARARGTWNARLYDDVPTLLPPSALACLVTLVTLALGHMLPPDVAVSLGIVTGAAGWAFVTAGRDVAAPRTVMVGEDGLALQGASGERFIPFHCIERVDESGFGVHLVLRGGEALALTVVPPRLLRDPAETGLSMMLAERRREHLLGLLRQQMARDASKSLGAGALLERRGRPMPAWQAALRRLVGDAQGGYRTAALTREHALGVVEDGGAPVELRVGAALALSPLADDRDTARRLRIAAESCASRDLREALEQAAEGEIEEATLERVLTA